MVAYLYRWRLHADREASFVAAWTAATEALRGAGSLGSRLHRGDDGWWYAYAQWPDEATRARAFAAHVVASSDADAMRAAVAERLPEVRLDVVEDLLRPAAY